MRIMTQELLCGSALGHTQRALYWRDVPHELSTRIAAIRRKLGLNQTEFGEKLGVNQATVSRWEKGSVPDGVKLAQIAQLAGQDVATLIEGDFEASQGGPGLFVKGDVAAGVWRDSWQWDQEDWQPYQGGSHVDAPADARFGLRVVGESMNEVYPPGTILDCVHCINGGDGDFKNGQRVIVIRKRWHGEVEATVKEFRQTDEGCWLVPRSSNPAFQQPIPLNGEEDPDIEAIVIVAIVRGSYRPE